MIQVFFFLLFFLPSISPALGESFIHCLAKEEEYYFRHNPWPSYKELNQQFLEASLMLAHARMRPAYEKQLCQAPLGKRSVYFMRILLEKGESAFQITTSDPIPANLSRNSIQQLINNKDELFIGMITQVQAQAPTAGCLEKNIPEITELFLEYKHLVEEIPASRIINKNQRAIRIVKKLSDPSDILANCHSKQ